MKRHHSHIRSALGAFAIALAVSQAAFAVATFTPLGGLGGWPAFASDARGVSRDGSVVVGQGYSSGGEAIRWTRQGGAAGLGDLAGGSFSSIAHAVSANGTVVVGAGSTALGDEAFRWTAAGGMVGLGRLPTGGSDSDARGVSADGSVVVGFNTSTVFEAFRWTNAEGMVGLGDLPGGSVSSRALGVSADGAVVVGVSSSSLGVEAFRWTAAGEMVGLGNLPNNGSILGSAAQAASADGSVIVGSSRNEAFRWTVDDGMTGLGQLSGQYSSALAVSADGSIVVGTYQTTTFQSRAFVWDALNGARDLRAALTMAGANLSGWTLFDASGISARGDFIVGTGVNPQGTTEAFLAYLPVPEPSGAALTIVAATMALTRTRAASNSFNDRSFRAGGFMVRSLLLQRVSMRRLMSCSLLVATGNTVSLADVTFETRALTGDAAPGVEPGVSFSGFHDVLLNAAGQLAFHATIAGQGVGPANNTGIWSERTGSLGLVARAGDAAPGTGPDVQFSSFKNPLLDAAGRTAFIGFLADAGGQPSVNGTGIWSERGGALGLVARHGDEAPGTSGGTFAFLGGAIALFISNPAFAFSSAGETAFRAILAPGAGDVTSSNDTGVWSEGGGPLGLVAREGDEAPGTGTVYGSFSTEWLRDPVINGVGQTAFSGRLPNPFAAGIWVAGNGESRKVAAIGDSVPGTGRAAMFYDFGERPYSINDAGQTAFLAGVEDENSSLFDYEGIWSERGGSLGLVAREGDPAPGTSSGVVFDNFHRPFFPTLLFNGAGHTAFVAVVSGPGVNTANDAGLWSDVGGSLALVAREGDAAPGTSAVFNALGGVELNGAGQFAFTASLAGAGVDFANGQGLWVRNPNGETTLILRAGEPFDVNDDPLGEDWRTIRSIVLSTSRSGSGGEDGRRTGFNEAGQLALMLEFTDGSQGVFVATIAPVPEPGGLALGILAAAALAARWNGRR